jgi:hypothetical protein
VEHVSTLLNGLLMSAKVYGSVLNPKRSGRDAVLELMDRDAATIQHRAVKPYVHDLAATMIPIDAYKRINGAWMHVTSGRFHVANRLIGPGAHGIGAPFPL